MAEANRQYAVDAADAQQNYDVGMAGPTEDYAKAAVQAERDRRVSMANGTATAAQADATKAATLRTAKQGYAVEEAAHSAQKRNELATANLSWTIAVHGASGADVVYTSAQAAASKTYAQAESTAYAAFQSALAGLDAGY